RMRKTTVRTRSSHFLEPDRFFRERANRAIAQMAKRALQRSAMLLAGRWHGTRVSRHRIGPVRIGVAICHVLLASGCAMNTPRPQRQAGLESATWALEMC